MTKRITGRMRVAAWFAAGALSLVVAAGRRLPATQKTEEELLKMADVVLQHVSKLRGLEPTTPIQKGVRSREEISQFLSEHVRQVYEEGELQAEGRILHRLGLVPESTDYKEFMLQLLTEQVGGYYDPDKKTLFLANWLPPDQQAPVMAHELMHALQDQHFGVGRLLKEDQRSRNDDQALAHLAIFEGDGMAVMLDYVLEPTGREFFQLPDLVFIMRSQFDLMDSQFPVFQRAPAFIKETLLFPYGYGAAFLQRVRAKEPWTAVDALYRDLPSSTEQILHPEKYFGSRDLPRKVQAEDPSARLGGDWRVTYRNVVGEFQLSLMLRAYGNSEERARKAAAGWGGDQVLLVESGDRDFVVLSTVWDSPEEATQFLESLGDWLSKRFSAATRSGESAAGYTIIDGAERHLVRREAARVSLMLGVPEAEAAKLEQK